MLSLDSRGIIRNATAWAGRCHALSRRYSRYSDSDPHHNTLLSIMALARDVNSENQQVSSNSPGPSASGRNTQNVESQAGPSQIRVEVTVLRAHNIPYIKRPLARKRQFSVTVTDLVTTKKTKSVQIEGHTVQWNQPLGAFSTQRSSHLTLVLYEKRLARRNTVIGTCEIPIPDASRSDVSFDLINGDGGAGRSTQPATLDLTITVSANMHPINPRDPLEISTKGGDTLADAAKSSMAQDSGEPFQSTAPEPHSASPDPLSVETGTPAPDSQAETSTVERARIALRHAEEAKKPIVGVNTRDEVISRIKWLMDTVSPVAGLHPLAKMAYNLISVIPQTLLEQYQRDENVLALLEAMRDAFDFAEHEDTLRSIKPGSEQAKALTIILQDVCNCGDFIQSYAKDSGFWKRTLKNVGGGATKKIEDLSATLVGHKKAFFDHTAINTAITVFQIRDGVGIIEAKVDLISTHLERVSSEISDDRLDATIREIPYGTGSRFTPNKGCLTGTRTTFLDFIVNWVNNTASERSLVLFGQAGTGKSSIAHEIARLFKKMHRLTSSFIFLRKEQHKPHHLFTTLARDLADRYPSFKRALGEIIKDDTSLRVGAGSRDYDTLFESLILEPLKGLHIVGPILVVIDALDESGDVTRTDGLHKFLAKNLSRLPPNFRVFITSRLEDVIKSAFVGAPSVRVKSMDDPELAVETAGNKGGRTIPVGSGCLRIHLRRTSRVL
ncbi:hypothetical protein EDB83DRAFT_1306557 [Lactarius deliciosus]|nr:hypothetical protein EDB83DRAFT_1306557 [Lactarius deliciosus]